jgi:phage baseplate assembly protein W
MQALQYPFGLSATGSIAVVTTYPELVKNQLIDALMTNFLERPMRPNYGSDLRSALFDPTDVLERSDAANIVAKRVDECTPRVILQSLKFVLDDTQQATVFVDVKYRVGAFDQTTQLRLPVSAFLNTESEI